MAFAASLGESEVSDSTESGARPIIVLVEAGSEENCHFLMSPDAKAEY